MKKIAIILSICVLFILGGCGITAKVEGNGYKSAEDAALAYANALKTGNVDEIMSTFAVETYVENYDLEKSIDYLGSYMPTREILFANTDEYTTGVNLINRQAAINKMLGYIYFNISDYEYDGRIAVIGGDIYSDTSELMDDLTNDDWMKDLAKMKVGGILGMEDLFDEEHQEEHKNMQEKRNAYFGCDEMESLAVEIELDGKEYYLCVDVACYDGKWYNCNPYGMIATLLGASTDSGGLVAID